MIIGETSLYPQTLAHLQHVIALYVLAPTETQHVFLCDCKPRPCNCGHPACFSLSLRGAGRPPRDAAIRSPGGSTKQKQHLRRIRSGDEFALSAADFFPPLQGRGLPRQCAHWLAMTGKRQMRTCVCKYVPTGKICNRLHVLFLPQFCGKRGLSTHGLCKSF